MSIPAKVTIEITGSEYTVKALDAIGNTLWSSTSFMEGPNSARGEKNQEDIFECKLLEDYSELQDAIDELSFGPFGIAGALNKISD